MINKVILVGNVGMDPEVRSLENGTKVARLRIATTERFYERETQQTREQTEWHTVTLWRGLADVADKYVRKGSQLYIEGRLQTREWTDKDGNKRYTTEVIAQDMKMLGRKSDGASYGEGAGAPGQAPAATAAASTVPPMSAPEIGNSAVEEADDLPF